MSLLSHLRLLRKTPRPSCGISSSSPSSCLYFTHSLQSQQLQPQLGIRSLHQSVNATTVKRPPIDNAKIANARNRKDYHAATTLDPTLPTFDSLRLRLPSIAELQSKLQSQWERHRHFFEGTKYPEAPMQKKPNRWLVWAFLGVNGAVYLAIPAVEYECNVNGNERPINIFKDNFLFSLKSMEEGKIWVTFTSSFTHAAEWHLIPNMLVLYHVVPPLVAFMGPTRFVAMWLASCVIGHATSLAWNGLERKVFCPNEEGIIGPQRQPLWVHQTLGASGPNMACLTTFLLLSPHTRVMLFTWIPTPLWIIASGLYFSAGQMAWTQPGNVVDHGNHLGGIIAGILFWRFGFKGARYRSLS